MPKEYSVWDTFLAETKEDAIVQAMERVTKLRKLPVTFDTTRTEVVGPFSPQMRHFPPPWPYKPGSGAFDVHLWWTEE